MTSAATYSLSDAQAIAADAPYTFFLPFDAELDAVAPGDLVKLIFELIPPGEKYSAERMWVQVTAVEGDAYTGILDNEPDEGRMQRGEVVTFHRRNIVSILWDDEECAPVVPVRREYWERCFVDECVLQDEQPVEFLYREEPDPQGDDRYPDSGWRFRGRQGDASDEEMEARPIRYVALGAVLNRDDSWLHLIDEPAGSAFMRDFVTGEYLRD